MAMQVMGVNGVSHHIVEDDLAGCTAALHWLAYVPAVLGGLPPTLPTSDPISRAISYAPGPSESQFTLYHTSCLAASQSSRFGTQLLLLECSRSLYG